MIRPFLVLACLTLPAAAQEVDCANAMAQQDLNQCAYTEWEAADADLNVAYQDAIDLMQSWDADLPEDEKGRRASVERGSARLDHLPRQGLRGRGLCHEGRQRRAASGLRVHAPVDRGPDRTAQSDDRGLQLDRLAGQFFQPAGKTGGLQP